MSSATLGLAFLIDFATAATLAFTGWYVLQRHPPGHARLATRAFAAWWLGLGWTVFLGAMRELVAAVGAARAFEPLVPALHATYVLSLCVAVWGLLYYLLYVFTGRPTWRWPTAIFYGLVFATATWLSILLEPQGLAVGKWFVGWDYANPSAAGGFVLVTFVLLLLPQLAAAIAYATLRRRTDEPELRRRITIVSTALIVWLGSSLVAPFLQLGRFEIWAAGGRLVGLAAAIVIARAFTHRIAEDAARRATMPRAVDHALLSRVHELI